MLMIALTIILMLFCNWYCCFREKHRISFTSFYFIHTFFFLIKNKTKQKRKTCKFYLFSKNYFSTWSFLHKCSFQKLKIMHLKIYSFRIKIKAKIPVCPFRKFPEISKDRLPSPIGFNGMSTCLVCFGLVSWRNKHCWLFNAEFTYILNIWFVNIFYRYTLLNDQTVLILTIQFSMCQLS